MAAVRIFPPRSRSGGRRRVLPHRQAGHAVELDADIALARPSARPSTRAARLWSACRLGRRHRHAPARPQHRSAGSTPSPVPPCRCRAAATRKTKCDACRARRRRRLRLLCTLSPAAVPTGPGPGQGLHVGARDALAAPARHPTRADRFDGTQPPPRRRAALALASPRQGHPLPRPSLGLSCSAARSRWHRPRRRSAPRAPRTPTRARRHQACAVG